jgi:hypothetical protein
LVNSLTNIPTTTFGSLELESTGADWTTLTSARPDPSPLVLASGDWLRAFGKEVFDAEEVVAVLQLAVQGVEAPAADAAANRDDDAGRSSRLGG